MNISEHKLGVLNFVIAVFALLISLRSCDISQDAYEQSNKEYKEERWLILTANFDEKSIGINVDPIDSSKTFLQGKVYFPPEIYKDIVPINSKGEVLHMGSVGYDLKEFIAKQIPKKSGYTIISDSQIPVIIESYYAAKGDSYTDVSLYMLSMTVVVSGDDTEKPSVHLNGLIFADRFPVDDPIDLSMLDKFVNEEVGIYIPAKIPQ